MIARAWYRIRYAVAEDGEALLSLMWQLAEFEAYADAFKVDAAAQALYRRLGAQPVSDWQAW